MERRWALLALLLQACLIPYSWYEAGLDVDGDGHVSVALGGDDCDDALATTHPDAEEWCGDNRDNDCDGQIDEDGAAGGRLTWRDSDGDGVGTWDEELYLCELRAGYVTTPGDCDDNNRDVHPGAREACNERDDDCDRLVDEDAPPTTWHRDDDGDTWGQLAERVTACQPPPEGSWVPDGGDCDDADPRVHPGVPVDPPYDGVDADCDGASDFDADADGYDVALDCDDADPARHPGQPERPYDAVDDDCEPANDFDLDLDGLPGPGWPLGADDCDDADPLVGAPFLAWLDADADGYGDPNTARLTCALGPAEVPRGGDCDDTRAAVRPDLAEVCDGLDNDCDGAPDDGVGDLWYPDHDADGFGVPAPPVQSCDPLPGFARTTDDCDDADPSVHPHAVEVCNHVDDDCDRLVDEGVSVVWVRDADGDGFAPPGAPQQVGCPADPLDADWTIDAPRTDCDDANAAVNPNAREVCNHLDDDCDLDVDEGLLVVWWYDGDGDTWGGDLQEADCPGARELPWVQRGGDCDDGEPDVSPGAVEVCNHVDDDCDGQGDEARFVEWFEDHDGDDYAPPGPLVQRDCPDADLDDQWSRLVYPGDCDDEDPDVHPNADEVCNEVDDDCDGGVDDGVQERWYPDADADGFAPTGAPPVLTCPYNRPGPGYSRDADDGDCDDTRDDVYPGNTEVCDGLDNDCATEPGGAAVKELSQPSVCAAIWAMVEDGSLYFVPATNGHGIWTAGQSECVAQGAHLIVPNGLGEGRDHGTYEAGDEEVDLIADAAQAALGPVFPRSSGVHLGLQGGCRGIGPNGFPADLYGYRWSPQACLAVRSWRGDVPALPTDVDAYADVSLALFQRPVPQQGGRFTWSETTTDNGDRATLCEREILAP